MADQNITAIVPYVPPVGPGSKSLPPTGSWRDLPPGLMPKRPRKNGSYSTLEKD